MQKKEKLVSEILRHKNLYYKGIPEISDVEFDKLEEDLKKIDPLHPVLNLVGSLEKSSDKVSHDKKMLSLDKTYDFEELLSWKNHYEILSTYKYDGSSCSLVYKKGKLVLAKTRGDGSVGENITPKALWIESIPKEIDDEIDFEVRGEVFCSEENFYQVALEMEQLKLERPSSQRNIVAGFFGRKDHINLSRYLTFTAFDLISDLPFKKEIEKYNWLKKNHFIIPDVDIHKDKESIKKSIDGAKEFMANGDILIDGLVFTINELKVHDELGETSHHPRYKIAFKFAGESKSTKIEKIHWGVSRNGILTPVAIVKPVELSGAKITNVTLHNYGMVRVHNLKAGDEIEIIRSGEVIPKFLRVIKSHSGECLIPKKCPSCDSEIKIEEIRIICRNPKCPEKLNAEILNFIQKIGIEDLSEKRLQDMINKNLVTDIPSLFDLTIEDLLTLDKTKDTLANKIFSNIEKCKKTDLITFLSALGISGGAYNKCEKVVQHGYSNIDKIKSLTREQLEEIEGFAEKSASDFLSSLQSKHKLIDKLIQKGFKFSKKENLTNSLEGLKICITGELSMKRSEMEKLIKSHGGILVSSVTTNTNYLLTNEEASSSSKFKKALELKTPIISEENFLKLLK
jgi:DNA ligase (NAD+)